jgi:hypothetical protein
MISVDLDAVTPHKPTPSDDPVLPTCCRCRSREWQNRWLKGVIVDSQPHYRLAEGQFEMGSRNDGKALRVLILMNPAPHYQMLYIRN